jgi:Asp/Glu/hydantoin racemase
MIRIWHQSFTELAQLPAYQKAMDAHVRRSVRADTEVVLHGVKPGTYPGNYPGTDIAHSALYTLHASQWITQALKASDEGFDAYAMCSLPNPYIREIRSLVDMPVVGYGEASFHLACMLGHRFGLMVFIAPMAQLYSEQIDLYGLKSRCAGVKPVGFTFHDVLKNWDNPGPLIDRFKASAAELIAAGADVIIPGEMPLNILLASNGVTHIDGVVVLDGLAITLKMAESMVELKRSVGLSHSRHGWLGAPPSRERVNQVLDFYGLKI